MIVRIAGLLGLVWLVGAAGSGLASEAAVHGLAMHGDLRYAADFAHFDYVDPKAPRGGEFRRAATGTFDSFHPFIIRGNPATGIGVIYDTLMVSSAEGMKG